MVKLRIPARPKSSPGVYEVWFPVDQVEELGPGKPVRSPRPEEVAEIRYFLTIRD